MDYLPTEILNQIISYIPEDDLAGYASVSQNWNAIIERQTFASVRLTLPRLLEFRQILGFSVISSRLQRRRTQVKSILFEAALPEYDVAARSEYENEEEQAQNNKAYSQAIKSLFQALALWPDNNDCQITLEIAAQSPSDLQAEPDKEIMRKRYSMPHIFGNEHDLFNERFAHSLLDIKEAKGNICLVTVVTALVIWSMDQYRKVTPSAQSKIISRLPRLRSTQLESDDNERKSEMLRSSLREGMQSLPRIAPTPRFCYTCSANVLVCIEFALSLAE